MDIPAKPPIDFAHIPIFPLPGVQLFPHAFLPLHIFEPRYCALLKHCMAGDRVMAIAALEPGFEPIYDDRPPVLPIIGVGHVIAHEELPDGRVNILLEGICRAAIDAELPPDAPYRIVRAHVLGDVVTQPGTAAQASDTLRTLVDQLALHLPTGGDTLRDLVRCKNEIGPLTDVLSAAMVTRPDERQKLLETLCPLRRAQLVTEELASVLASLADTKGPAN